MNKAHLQETHCPIPMIVQWREESKIIEASAENDFRFQRLLEWFAQWNGTGFFLGRIL